MYRSAMGISQAMEESEDVVSGAISAVACPPVFDDARVVTVDLEVMVIVGLK